MIVDRTHYQWWLGIVGSSILVGAGVGGALFLGLYSLAENAIFSGIAAGAVGVMAAAKLVQIQARDA